MFKNLGVTLMELLIVLVIVGILAALRFSDFGKLNEKNKGVEAEANLYMIYNAQKRYALENEGIYYDCPISTCNHDDVYNNLGIEFKWDNFTYEVNSITSPITAFIATAAREGTGGLCDGRIMTIDQDGGEVNNEVNNKGCERW